MAFIKVQKLVRNEHGEVLSGSAAIMDTVYTPGSRNFSKHRVIESLGKVVYFDKNLKSVTTGRAGGLSGFRRPLKAAWGDYEPLKAAMGAARSGQ